MQCCSVPVIMVELLASPPLPPRKKKKRIRCGKKKVKWEEMGIVSRCHHSSKKKKRLKQEREWKKKWRRQYRGIARESYTCIENSHLILQFCRRSWGCMVLWAHLREGKKTELNKRKAGGVAGLHLVLRYFAIFFFLFSALSVFLPLWVWVCMYMGACILFILPFSVIVAVFRLRDLSPFSFFNPFLSVFVCAVREGREKEGGGMSSLFSVFL